MSSNMPAEVEARIRALPGNKMCCDCNNVNPQWATVSYGALMCLECSGQHRSLGVHLSFVRSIQMDSWTPQQIDAMEKSGGNAKLVEYFSSRGIDKSMPVHQKYNTKQAAFYRERLKRWLDGKTEPPPDPGRYDPATGGSEAQGAEPLPGETTEEYNARQARLREAARERLKAKFGGGGMGGVGSSANTASGGFQDDDEWGTGLGGAVGAVAGVAGNVASGLGSFINDKVINNDNLSSSVRGAAGTAMETGSSAWSSLRQTVADGELVESLKRNATLQDGSVVSKGLGWGMGAVGSLWETATSGIGSVTGALADEGRTPQAHMQGPHRQESGSSFRMSQDMPQEPGRHQMPSAPKPTSVDDDWFDNEFGDFGTDRQPSSLAKPQRGMDLKSSSPVKPHQVPSASPSASASASLSASPSASPQKSQQASSPSPVALSPGAAEPKATAKDELGEPDDFFKEFGL